MEKNGNHGSLMGGSNMWFDILKVEDEFTPFEEWVEATENRGSYLYDTIKELSEQGRRYPHIGADTLQTLTDAYGSNVREWMAENKPEIHQKAGEFLEGVVNSATYAELEGDIITLTPTWLNRTLSMPYFTGSYKDYEDYEDITEYLLDKTCVDSEAAARAERTKLPITAITIDTGIRVKYIVGNSTEVEVCLHSNLLPSGDQIGFLVLAAENMESWLKIWENAI